jgi:hypothetical protein
MIPGPHLLPFGLSLSSELCLPERYRKVRFGEEQEGVVSGNFSNLLKFLSLAKEYSKQGFLPSEKIGHFAANFQTNSTQQ